jgi:hypothetical protein
MSINIDYYGDFFDIVCSLNKKKYATVLRRPYLQLHEEAKMPELRHPLTKTAPYNWALTD